MMGLYEGKKNYKGLWNQFKRKWYENDEDEEF